MIAALYVASGGCYYDLADVDPWDEVRDARLYDGNDPVVAHPPCSSWCQLASVNEARWGSPIGADGGTFAAALETVRRVGGVLEHPAYSIAWARYDLPRPQRGCWSQSLDDPGWVTEVSQVAYGHLARKRTWLYYVGPPPPPLDWSEPEHSHVVGAGIHSGQSTDRPKLENAIHTPIPFRDLLLDLARKAL